MTVYLTNDSDLTSIANAIRTKSGTSSSLTYPTGFVTAINNVSSGGGGGGSSTHLLTFDNSVENTSVIYSDGNDVADASSDSVNIQGGELVVIICWDNFQFVVTGATTDIAPAQYYEGVFAFVMPDEDITLSVA